MKVLSSLLLALVFGGCAALPDAASARPSATPTDTHPTASLAQVEACTAASQIESMLETFARAVNDGDRGRVEAAVSSAAQWFSITTPSGHEVAYGHNDIVRQLLAMHAAGDRFVTTPTPVQVTLQGWDGAGHFGLGPFTFQRGGERMQLMGKGAIYCGGRVRGVEVMSVGVLN
jgi:hypothetical protein